MKRIMVLGYRILGIAACLVALYFNSGLNGGGQLRTEMFTFYTILSNILVLLYFVLALTPVARWQWLRGGTGMAILLTMLVYNIMLVPYGFSMSGGTFVPYTFPDVMVHIVVPCMMMIDALFLAKKDGYRWHYPLTWTVFPLIYLAYALIRGAVTGKFAYFFLDYNTLGVTKVAIYCLVLSAAYIAVGYLLVVWNKFVGRSPRRREQY